MKITIKLFGTLQDYLPSGARDNSSQRDLPAETSLTTALAPLKIPDELLQLVLLNDVLIPKPQRDQTILQDGDIITIWPPITGG